MSCCGKGTLSALSAWTPLPDFNKPTFMLPGESVECYMNRSGDPSGDYRGAPEEEPNKITTNTIPVKCDMSVDVTFKVSTSTVTSWKIHDEEYTEIPPPPPLLFDTSTGTLTGTFQDADEKKVFNIRVSAYNGREVIDTRSYVVIPKKCVDGEDIKLLHPLPRAKTTSFFGPRKSPCTGCSANHGGLDFSYGPGNYDGGKPVICSADGIVEFNGEQNGYGNIVIVKHENAKGNVVCRTAYAHLGRALVQQGQKVSAGTPVGLLGGQYGWSGIGTGVHLHYELRLPGLPGKGVTDPLPYIDGDILLNIAGVTPDGESDPGTLAGTDTTMTNTNVRITQERGSYQPCPVFDAPAGPDLPDDPNIFTPSQQIGPSRASCRPEITPTAAEVKSQIDAVLDIYSDLALYPNDPLDASDRLFIHITAQIESNYDPYAKNKISSATGLYQFLDQLANAFYGGGKFQSPALAGIPPTCENRCNVTYATHAMVAWYKKEILPAYKSYKDSLPSGRPKILGSQIAINEITSKYATYTKAEWCYAFHHAGLPAMIAGTDTQGAQYIQKRKSDFA